MAATKLSVITGTARPGGIGRACAVAFLQAGWHVASLDRLELEGEEGATLAGLHHLCVDLSSPEQVASLPAALRARSAQVQVACLLNNAAIADPFLPASADPVAHWHALLATNLSAPYLLTHALHAASLLAPAASIVHVSSTRALQAEPHTEAYSAAKAGLLGLARAQAMSLAPLHVNAVLPGWIDTSGEALRPEDHAWHPAGRVGRPADVAEMCLFLADGARSGFVTGQSFVVDGGVTAKMVYPE